MNILNILSSLRKLWYFLIGLFPFLQWLAQTTDKQLARVFEQTKLAKRMQSWLESPKGKALADVIRRFYWRDFKPDQLDLALLPAPSLVVLRPVFLLSVVLCLLLPFAACKLGTQLPIRTDGGFTGTASSYTVWIWFMACALGWGCLLGGAANSNYIFFAVVGYIYVLSFGACAFYLPRSGWNAILPLTALLACALAERALRKRGRLNLLCSLISHFVVAAYAGIYLVALTPLQPLCTPNVLPIGIASGCVFALGLIGWSRFGTKFEPDETSPSNSGISAASTLGEKKGSSAPSESAQSSEISESTEATEATEPSKSGEATEATEPIEATATIESTETIESSVSTESLESIEPLSPPKSGPAIGATVWIMTICNAAFMLSLIFRSDIGSFGEKLISLLLLWNAYIWPVWYFIGVGIIFKFLKSTKLVVSAAREISNQKSFVPLMLGILFAAACICWSSDLALLPAAGLTAIPQSIFNKIHEAFDPLWSKEINILAASEMKWVLLFDVIAVAWLALKRRLNNDSSASLLYLSLLAWFLITEFLFEEFGFLRPPGHDLITVTLFGIWIIWIFHTMGLKASLESTPSWPSTARLPIYGSVMLFSLAQLYGRSCIHDFSSMNIIYLTLYRGILDVGLPYFFYVYATRRFKELPISTLAIFALFCCGAALALPVNVLDKFALSNFSQPASFALWDRQYHLFVEQGVAFLPDFRFSGGWILFKAAITVGSITLLAATVLCRQATTGVRRNVDAVIIFSLMAFVSGFASFSKAQFDLPIPPKFLILITPPFVAMKLDATMIEPYLAFWLPALCLALCLAWNNKKTSVKWTAGIVSAFLLHWSITAAWPNQKIWLISTQTFTTLGLALLFTLAYLIFFGIQVVERQEKGVVGKANEEESHLNASISASRSASEDAPPIVSVREATVIYALVIAVCAFFCVRQIQDGQMVMTHIDSLQRDMMVPKFWGTPTHQGRITTFSCPDGLSGTSRFFILRGPSAQHGAKDTLQQFINDQHFTSFNLEKSEEWSYYKSGAIAAVYSFSASASSSTPNSTSANSLSASRLSANNLSDKLATEPALLQSGSQSSTREGNFPSLAGQWGPRLDQRNQPVSELAVTAVVPHDDGMSDVYTWIGPRECEQRHRCDILRILRGAR